MTPQRLSIVPPVGIRGVENRRFRSHGARHGHELAIVPIETVEGRIVWELPVAAIGIGNDRNGSAVALVGLMVPEPHEEGIPRAGLTRRMQVAAILVEDVPSIIQHDATVPANGLKRGDAGGHAAWPGLLSRPVRHRGNVRVYDHVQDYKTPIRLRCAAMLMAATSPNSSPKKSSGQFLMFP